MTQYESIFDNLVQELRRGSLVLFVLIRLESRQYGYSLLQSLADQGIAIEAGTLYPLMRRLEKQGLLDSEWEVEEGRPRKYYTISQNGQAILQRLKAEWKTLSSQIDTLLADSNNR